MKSISISLLVAAALFAGCGAKDEHAGHDHDHDHGHGAAHKHEHRPPHGGTPVVLGNEAFHLEFVRDAVNGSLTCYVMDAHLESFVRIAAPVFTVAADVAGSAKNLEFKAVANGATGEKEGDTSQFDAKADWLKTATNFTGNISELTVRGVKFSDIKFRFPEGNE